MNSLFRNALVGVCSGIIMILSLYLTCEDFDKIHLYTLICSFIILVIAVKGDVDDERMN